MSIVRGLNIEPQYILNARPLKYVADVQIRIGPPRNLLDAACENNKKGIEDEHQSIIKSTFVIESTSDTSRIRELAASSLDLNLIQHTVFILEDSVLVSYHPPGFSGLVPAFSSHAKNILIIFRQEDEMFKISAKHADCYYCKHTKSTSGYGEKSKWKNIVEVEIYVSWQWTVQEVVTILLAEMSIPEEYTNKMLLCYSFKGKRIVLDDFSERIGAYFTSGNIPIFQHSYAYGARNTKLEFVLAHSL